MQNKKITGVVVPLGSLYTKENQIIGEFPDLIPFVDFCKTTGFSLIQLLPVNDTGTQSSPYSGLSAFALHPIYIRIKNIPNFSELYETNKKFAKNYDDFNTAHKFSLRYDYDSILNSKIALLQQLYENTEVGKSGKPDSQLSKWIKANPWIISYAVYKTLKWNYMQASWKTWHEDDQHKTQEEILQLWETKAFKKEHLFYAWVQFIAENQFLESVNYAKQNKILLKGDMPILMNEDSCDAWAYPQFFNQNLRAGSPADGENPTGQNWGFPTYNWQNLEKNDYSWWKERLQNGAKFYDAYRLDHILGFFRIWAIPDTDFNALNGHTEPYSSIKKDSLYELGFDDERIRWLSKPHIPTSAIQEITQNYELSYKILEKFCTRIQNEELWLFKKNITGHKDIYAVDFADLSDICTKETENKVKELLIKYWSNITLLEITKNKFIPLWTYSSSTSWSTLNDDEKSALEELFACINKKNEKLWAKQAEQIFTSLTSTVKSIPCGEDLGVSIDCVPKTMKKHNILGLRVVRWCREWQKEGQPFVDFDKYKPLSVTTTSVHDSSTIRQWWNDEKDSVKAFVKANFKSFEIEDDENNVLQVAEKDFSPEIAQIIMKTASSSKSIWNISPLQDYLFMEQKYWLENAEDERINIPGTVTKFNWTYRLPVSIEELQKNKTLQKKISEGIK